MTTELFNAFFSGIVKSNVVIMMIKIAVCDDEQFMLDQLSSLISENMLERQVSSYSIQQFKDGTSLLNDNSSFDLIFLDIQMNQPNGMETAKRLRQIGNQSLLIFVTILKELVFDAFEVQAYDYLIKPLDTSRFKRMMDRAFAYLKQKEEKTIIIQKRNAYEIIRLSEIVYGEVWGRKIYLHQKDGKITDYYEKLENLEKHVDQRFFRCHRSYLVNLDYVHGCSKGQVLLSQGSKIPVSRLREQEFAQALLRHMKDK